MRRTIYRNRFLVDDVLLNNTENTKIAEILLHHEVLGEEGVIEGLEVSPSSFVDGAVDVTSGSAVLPNREIVKIATNQNAVEMSSSGVGDINIVVIAYEESLSNPKPDITGGANNLVFADPTPVIRVYASADYLALTQSVRDTTLVIAVIIAEGASTAISEGNIYATSNYRDLTNFKELEILKGVIVKSTTVAPNPNPGSIRYNASLGLISFISPNNPNPPPINFGGLDSKSVNTSLRDSQLLVLTDPQAPGDEIIVEIYGSSLPDATTSFSEERRLELVDEGRISGSMINENINLNGLYSQNLTQISDDLLVEVPKQSAVDRRHRNLIGSGIVSSTNPHGISLQEILNLFDEVPGNFRIGDELLSTAEEAEFPRIKVNIPDNSLYVLFFESNLPNQGALGVNPARIYVGKDTIFATLNAKYNPVTQSWNKDSQAILNNLAIKVQLTANEFSISYNELNQTFNDLNGWKKKVLTNDEYTILQESLGIVPRTNQEHNSAESNIFSALLNAGLGVVGNRKIPIYEDKNLRNGVALAGNPGLRIYMGRDFSSSGGDNVIEFTQNAKNSELTPSNWTRDVVGDCYLFRFRFNSDLNQLDVLESKVATPLTSTFNDSSFSAREFLFPGGFKNFVDDTESPPPFEAGLVVYDSIKYREPRSKRRVVSLSDVVYQSISNQDVIVNFENRSSPENNGYFERDKDDPRPSIMDVRLPFLICIENIGVNQFETNTPKLTWRGPERPFISDAHPNNDGDCGFVGTKRYPPGVVHKFIFPLSFEEPEVLVKRITLTWDWFYTALRPIFPPGLAPLPFTDQEFFWGQGFDPANRWLNFNLVAVNYVTGDSRLVNPNINYGDPPIVWENEDGTTNPGVNKVIRMRNPSDEGILFSYNRNQFLDEEFLQLQISTDQTFLDTNGDPKIEYRPLIIGNPIIEYDSEYLV